MSSFKYSSTRWGTWEHDDNDLPCFTLDPVKIPATATPVCHLIGNGSLALAADHLGRSRLLATDLHHPRSLSPADWDRAGAVFLTLTVAGREYSLAFCELRKENQPRVTFGIGYVSYAAHLLLGEDTVIATRLELVSPQDQPCIFGEISLHLLHGEAVDASLRIAVEVGLMKPGVTVQAPARNFCREGIAMFTEMEDAPGDLFLAAGAAWTAGCARGTLRLERQARIARRTDLNAVFLFGCQRDCSLSYVQRRFKECAPVEAKAAWAKRLTPHAPKFAAPSLQDECLWNAGIILSCRARDPAQNKPVFSPGGAFLAGSGGAAVRDLLSLTLALREREPELALNTLRAVATAQARNGRLPECFGNEPLAQLVPARDRSDLEIWFLLAWCETLERNSGSDALLKEMLPFADGHKDTLWHHLRLAFRWLRDEIGTGARGLVRILAGDSNGFLNCVGREGRGESVLNTAMALYALDRLESLARHRRDVRFADEIAGWAGELRAAAGRAFDQGWFCRASTDDGQLLGGATDDRLFLDVQAWALLARCGTTEQREAAVENTLARNQTETGLSLLSNPYPLPPPEEVSDRPLPAGDGENGGVSLPVTAWFVWGLASQGRRDLASSVGETLSLRRRQQEHPELSPAQRAALPLFSSSRAGQRAGGPGFRAVQPHWALPELQALAWLDFALRRIQGA